MMRSLTLFALLSLFAVPALADDVAPAADGDTAVAEKEDSHRLPPYFRDVVTDDQRAEVYAIQDKYKTEIDALQKQLLALLKKQRAEMNAVLTPEQRAAVKTLAADAKAQRDRLRKIREAAEKKEEAEDDAP